MSINQINPILSSLVPYMASNCLVAWKVPDALRPNTTPPNSLMEPFKQTKAEATLVTTTEPTTFYTISFVSYLGVIHDMPGID